MIVQALAPLFALWLALSIAPSFSSLSRHVLTCFTDSPVLRDKSATDVDILPMPMTRP